MPNTVPKSPFVSCDAILKVAVRSLFCMLVSLWLATATAYAQGNNADGILHVEVGQGVLIPNTFGVESVFVSDPSVADLRDSPEETLFLFGKSVGTTSLIAADLNGDEMFRYTVVVSHQISEIKNMLIARFPAETVTLRSSRGSILVSGALSNARVREDLFASLEAAFPDTAIIDETTVVSSNIVRLDVKLLEVNSSRAEQFGVDISALVSVNGFSLGVQNRGVVTSGFDARDSSGGLGVDLSATLDLLVSREIATIVTETSLSAVSSKEATFEVGGEIPVPTFTTDGNNRDFSLSYKFVGLLLEFIPLRVEENKVLLNIGSSITNIQDSSLAINGNTFPTLNTRRFKTDVELADKQSFVIAGLSQETSLASLRDAKNNNPTSRMVAALFGNDRTQSDRRELIIVVTPYFRQPERKRISPEVVRTLSNLEYLISKKIRRKHVTFHGTAGFIY